jgi:demethylmenaquinone methyltransferase/2-methoxy-6-polyprenyl-1,4-benzoquinol methylase
MKQLTKTWNRNNLKDPHRLPDKQRRVRTMFSEIAGTYDLLNHLLSLNMDRRWRRRAVELAQVAQGQSVLDLCCGTGELAMEFAKNQPHLHEIIGVDFSQAMLAQAAKKTQNSNDNGTDRYNHSNIRWLCADAQKVPLPNERFDCVGCAFGIRNLADLPVGLEEIHRLLKPKGKMVILEFALPNNRLFRWAYMCYFRLVLPLIGGIISKDKHGAYQYLPDSVRSFKTAQQLDNLICQAGFTLVRSERLCVGAVLAVVAEKQ